MQRKKLYREEANVESRWNAYMFEFSKRRLKQLLGRVNEGTANHRRLSDRSGKTRGNLLLSKPSNYRLLIA